MEVEAGAECHVAVAEHIGIYVGAVVELGLVEWFALV